MENHLLYVASAYIFSAFVVFVFVFISLILNKKIKIQLKNAEAQLSKKIQ